MNGSMSVMAIFRQLASLVRRLIEQCGAVPEEFVEKIGTIVYEPPHDLHGSRVLILEFLKDSIVKRDDLRVGIAQQDRRMTRNDELSIPLPSQNIMEENEKG